jgi:hypothetical protein
MYDHSGVVLSTTPFSCPWDSGQLGIIYATREKIVAEGLGGDDEKVREILRGEVKVFYWWLNGECYGYTIEDPDGDSCFGFIGRGAAEEAAREAGAEVLIYE